MKMKPSKQARKNLTLNEKKQIIEAASDNVTQTELAKRFEVPRTTIIGIIKSKEMIQNAIESGNASKRIRIKSSRNEELEQAILIWFKQVRSQNISVIGQLLQEKAREIAAQLQISEFRASNGWLEKFLRRHSITLKSVQGEVGDINWIEVNNWQQGALQDILKQYSPNDIFNVDETGLFWRLLPNKTLSFKGERCTTGKKSKERITILVGANMTGTEKVPLLVIGKSANAKTPVRYTANKKSLDDLRRMA